MEDHAKVSGTMPEVARAGTGEPIRVAVVIPILNEAPSLCLTLAALLKQDYPPELLEILIIDGGSVDDWKSAVPNRGATAISIRLLDNPQRTTAAAVNLALRSSQADAILWISGHCVLSPNYISESIAVHAESRTLLVGGRLEVKGCGTVGRLNAMVLSSPFGTGMSPLRFGRTAGETETVTFAICDRLLIIELGGLNERLVRNQDIDLWDRLRAAGARFRRADTVATYLAPPTFGGLWRRAFHNGRWNIWGQRIRRGGLSWWHFAPMAMVFAAVLLSTLSLVSPAAGLTLFWLAVLYGVLAIVSGCVTAVYHRALWGWPALPLLYFIHHAIYGLGAWTAVFLPVPSAPMNTEHAGSQTEEINGVPNHPV